MTLKNKEIPERTISKNTLIHNTHKFEDVKKKLEQTQKKAEVLNTELSFVFLQFYLLFDLYKI